MNAFQKHKLCFLLGCGWIVSYTACIINAGYSIAIFTSIVGAIMLLCYRGRGIWKAVIISGSIFVGLLLAIVYAWKRAKQFGIRQDDITDGVLWVVPFAVLCARLYYCAFEWDTYKDNPISVLYIWQGGLAIYGGVIGALIGVAVYCHFKKIKVAALLDLVALGFMIGQSLGRWGNFFNREAFGGETDIFLRMGLLNSITGETTYHHPTFLYESLWNAAGFAALHFLSKKREYDGQIALGYAAWYGLGRFFIEGLRTDSLYLPGTSIRVSQALGAASFLIAAAVLVYFMFKPPVKPLFVNRAAENTETCEGGTEDE
jgi:phosphatidylglycerol:prolipoprotein diacylglycerol transferase